MSNFDPDDGLPTPKRYLIAGLTRPQTPSLRSGGNSLVKGDSLPARDTNSDDYAPGRTVTTVDGEGNPTLVVGYPSIQFLAAPHSSRYLDRKIVDRSRDASGVWTFRTAGPLLPIVTSRNPDDLDLSTARVVTFDQSVVIAGLDKSKFKPNDAIFITAALELELSVVRVEDEMADGSVRRSSKFWSWGVRNPVPEDANVLELYKRLFVHMRDKMPGSGLDRTDLICAAAAIVHDAPLYSARPEAYVGLKHGLKVLAYGVSKKATTKLEARANPTQALDDPTNHESSTDMTFVKIREAFAAGDAPPLSLTEKLSSAGTDSEQVLHLVWQILSDRATDIRWRQAILKDPETLRKFFSSGAEWHGDIVYELTQDLTYVGGDESRRLQAELATDALANWGQWPDDAGDDMLSEIETPSAAGAMTWYRIFLGMAGLSAEEVATEMDAVAEGQSTPSRARIEQLRFLHQGDKVAKPGDR